MRNIVHKNNTQIIRKDGEGEVDKNFFILILPEY
jgi:hypothetical protein